MTPDFSGEYRVSVVADFAAADLGLSDKPCYRIDGPGGLVGFTWTWRSNEDGILREWFEHALDIDLPIITPSLFTVSH